MINVLLAEQNRLLSRRITSIFPLVLAALMVLGCLLAWLVLTSESESFDFVELLGETEGESVIFGRDGEIPVDRGMPLLWPLGFLVPIMAFVIAASYYGADERAGMIEHLLTWEPRRTRLLLARSVAGVLSMFGITIVLSGFFVLVIWLLSAVTGTTEGVTGELWGDIALSIVRNGVVAALFFLLGLGVTVLTNSSIGSIVGFLIYVFVIETTLFGTLLPNVRAWFPKANATSFIEGSDFVAPSGIFEDEFFESIHHGYIQSGLIIVAWVAVFWVLGLVRFHFRDVD